MNEEEKKAIKELTEIKELVEEDLKYDDYEATATLDQIDLKSLIIVLNLIEKQQKEIKELKEYKKISELTKISCCTAQNCEALNNAIREGLENQKLREEIEKKDKMIDLMVDEILDLCKKQDLKNEKITIWLNKKHILNYFIEQVEKDKKE